MNFICLALLFIGCTSHKEIHGHYNLHVIQALQKLKVHRDTKETVLEKLGHPTIPVLFDENSWQYISQESIVTPTHKVTPIKTSHYTLCFDEKGYLVSIKTSHPLSKKIELDQDSTPAQGYSEGVLKDVFGNIGRYGLRSE